MLTNHELTRIRRQAHRRIRLVLAQRRIAADRPADGGPEQPAAPPRPSAEPASEH